MNRKNVIGAMAQYGNYLVVFAVLIELIFFYSIETASGCCMTIVCWILFRNYGLKEDIIIDHLFPWLIFFSMSMYRILPIFATLMEWKPINYRFEMGCKPFIGETMLYVISTVAFVLACKTSSNGGIRKTLNHFHFYDTLTPAQLWVAGIIGLIIRIYFQFADSIEEGDAGSRFLLAFRLLQMAPLLLFFPLLYNDNEKEENSDDESEENVCFSFNKPAMIYLAGLFFVSFLGNSRNAMIEPIITVVLLGFVSLIKAKTSIEQVVNHKTLIFVGIPVFFILPMLSDFSTAMLINRSIRKDISATELFKTTLETFQDKESIRLYHLKNKLNKTDNFGYDEGWTEEYVSNFALNRYCNIRVTDITLYHADKIGYNNSAMKEDLLHRIFALLPLPVFNFFHFEFSKNSTFNSRGDFLYNQSSGHSIGGYRVTSHLADGLATFGYWYFIIQFFLFFLEFRLIDNFSIHDEDKMIHSIFGLIMLYSFLGMFRNANGMMNEIGYILRGFWQQIFILCIINVLIRRIRVR